jgi:hypothetical protein
LFCGQAAEPSRSWSWFLGYGWDSWQSSYLV